MAGKPIDLTGQKFGKLTAISYAGNQKWLFRCDCGTEKVIAATGVKRLIVQSCGCLQKELATVPKKDITGQKFNKLTAVRYFEKGKWLFKCECGNEKALIAYQVKNSLVKSCGCSRHDYSANINDLTGKKFGRWTVLQMGRKVVKRDAAGMLTGSNIYWHSRCDCGTEREVIGGSLTKGQSRSCGCIELEKSHVNHVGMRYGFLTVLRTYKPTDKSNGNDMARAVCLCVCGNETDVIIQNLAKGDVKSCGCLRKEASRQRLTKLYHAHDMIRNETKNQIEKWVKKETI